MKFPLGLFSRSRDTAAADAKQLQASQDLIRQGNELEDRGDVAEALELYQRAVGFTPSLGDAHFNFANALSMLGRMAGAVSSYRRAIELDPQNANVHLNLGATLLRMGSAADAERSYRETVRLRPQSANAWTGLGCALEMGGDNEGAFAAFEKALELDSSHGGAASRLAELSWDRGEARRALEILALVLEKNPSEVNALRAKADVCGVAGEYDEAIAAYRRILSITSQDLDASSNLLWTLNFVPGIDAAAILAEHRRVGAMLAAITPRMPLRRPAPLQRRLRVGYVSADFRRHSVSCFIEPLLRHHDRARFEVHCFFDHSQADDVTKKLSAHAEHWLDIAGEPDEDVARVISNLGIDVLVDLAGHSAHNRMRLFAAKPAPLQFTWLGYLCTTGLTTIDYRVCDEHTDPRGVAEQWQVEAPARLPDSQWCYSPQVPVPEPSALPWRRNGFWTFGSFNQESKLNGTILDAWAQALASIPDSRLRVVGVTCDIVADRIRHSLARHGIGIDRLDLVGRVPIEDYFPQYCEVDVALDTFPYNGATTTCDALIMGVPVATIAGNRAIARGGLSLMSTVGLADWVATESSSLADMLRRHLANPERIEALRRDLSERMRRSPLMDGARFAQDFENLLTSAWQHALAQRG
jgi:predicted O-linked N-acetylglucosamine transferase (SPINDLY family)